MQPNIELKDAEAALRRQLSKRVQNVAFRKPTFVSLLMAMDTFYNKKANTRINKEGIKGGKMQVNIWQSLPQTRGSNPLDPDYRSRLMPIVKNAHHNAFTVDPSAYEGSEPVDKYEENRLAGDKAMANYVSQLADRFAESIIKEVDADLFPATQQVGAAGNPATQSSLMALAYPLQTGYASNAATGSGTYMYFGIDMNLYTNMKAVNYGTASSAVTSSVSNIRKRLLMPLQDRGANIDLILAGTADFGYLMDQADGPVRYGYSEELQYGGTYFKLGNAWVVYESGIDRLPVPELYALDSSTWTFCMDPEGVKKIDYIDKVPGGPSFGIFQHYTEFGFLCENPRFNGRLYNTQIP